jgi:hypothetical protein
MQFSAFLLALSLLGGAGQPVQGVTPKAAAAAAESTSVAKDAGPVVLSTPKAGDTAVHGVVADAATEAVVVTVTASGGGDVRDRQITRDIGPNGEFTVTLKTPPAAGDDVRVVGIKGGAEVTQAATAHIGPKPSPKEELAAAPTIAPPPDAGTRAISGFVSPETPDRVTVIVLTVNSSIGQVLERDIARLEPQSKTSVVNKGAFTVPLRQPLPTGAAVTVYGADEKLIAVTKSATAAPVPAPTLQEPINEGTKAVSGYVPASLLQCAATGDGKDGSKAADAPAGPCVKKIAIVVYGHVGPPCVRQHRTNDEAVRQKSKTPDGKIPPGDRQGQSSENEVQPGEVPPDPGCDSTHADEASDQQFVERAIAPGLDSGGNFTAQLKYPLVEGETIHAVGVDEQLNQVTTLATADVVSPTSWGRVRAYLMAGGVVSKTDGNFSHLDPELRFLLDTNWWQYRDIQKSDHRHAGEMALDPPARDGHSHKRTHFFQPRQLNGFFDARATSIPLSSGTATDGHANTGSGSDLSSFASSPKAAQVQAGAYMAMYGDRQTWSYHGERNALFFGPAFRYGVSVPETTDRSSDSVAPCDVCTFYSFGIIFGHQKLPDTSDRAPEMISFLYISAGKWQNLAQPTGSVDAHGNPKLLPDWRLSAEGRMKIPRSIFEVGFDANVRHKQNDVRFFFGARVDIGELIGKISPSGSH